MAVCNLPTMSTAARQSPVASPSSRRPPSSERLRHVSTELLPNVCALCLDGAHSWGLVAATALSLLSVLLQRNLAGEDGVRLVFKHLKLGDLFHEATNSSGVRSSVENTVAKSTVSIRGLPL